MTDNEITKLLGETLAFCDGYIEKTAQINFPKDEKEQVNFFLSFLINFVGNKIVQISEDKDVEKNAATILHKITEWFVDYIQAKKAKGTIQ